MNTKPSLSPTIGLEIHVELKTLSKMFCGCPADHFRKPPNTQTCPVCLGLPGALPVPNHKAVDWTILIGHALNCSIQSHSKFDRKHYFYPDLPKGYQISQYDQPLCTQGHLSTNTGRVNITRVHLEEDTGKLQHTTIKNKRVTLIDFNRSGVPLVEIVSEPDITSSTQASDYAKKVRNIVQFLGVSDGDLEKGSLRLEANISWGLHLDYKVEVKNINSYRFLVQAIDYELKRQRALLDKGTVPIQETRGWHEGKNATVSQRRKELAQDYRYFPEPDIPPLYFSPAQIDRIIKTMPPLPHDYYFRFTHDFHVRSDYAHILTAHRQLATKSLEVFRLAAKSSIKPDTAAGYLINQKTVARRQTPQQIIQALKSATTSPTASKTQTQTWVDLALSANPDLVEKYLSGKHTVIAVLIGQVMRQGPADPQLVKKLLTQKLNRSERS